MWKFAFLWLLLLASFSQQAFAKTEHYEAHVYSTVMQSHDTVTAGQSITLGVLFEMEPDWHIYWKNAGDAGLPTKVSFASDFIHQDGELHFETPIPFEYDGFINYGYKNKTTLFANFTVDPRAKLGDIINYQAEISYLSCKDICLPGKAFLEHKFTVGEKAIQSSHKDVLLQAKKNTPEKAPFKVRTKVTEDQVKLAFDHAPVLTKEQITFIPVQESIIVDNAPFSLEEKAHIHYLSYKKDPYYEKDGIQQVAGLLILNGKSYYFGNMNPAHEAINPIDDNKQADVKFEPTAIIEREDITEELALTIPLALLFAFIGGLILNLMPCVLPVLSLKVMSVLHHSRQDNAKHHGLAYTLGILSTFAVIGLVLLSLRSGGEELGWGFQLQSPLFVAVLTLLMTLVALQLFNVFEVGHSLTRLGGLVKGHSLGATYFGGVLMTLVATPCTAPFMAPAFGFALMQESSVAYATFFSLGLGLAAPYVLLTAKPSLLKRLPKPGPWEDTFKTLLGFPMLATALWLLWVYAEQTSVTATFIVLTGLLLATFCAWIFGKLNIPTKSKTTHRVGSAIFLIGLIAFFAFAHDASKRDAYGVKQKETLRQEWSLSSIEQDVAAGKTVFVDFTARWCITCQVNKAVALRNNQLKEYMTTYNAVFYEADWTLKDEKITEELRKHQRAGVPLYLVYKDGNMQPQILPSVITESIVTDALK